MSISWQTRIIGRATLVAVIIHVMIAETRAQPSIEETQSGLTSLGIGGIFAIMLIREAVSLVRAALQAKRGSNGQTAGELTPEYWHEQQRLIVRQSLGDLVIPVLRQSQEDTRDLIAKFSNASSLQHDNIRDLKHTLDTANKSLSDLTSKLQALIGLLERQLMR